MSLFDLRTSPFYLLGVSPRDNSVVIAEAMEMAVSDCGVDEAIAVRAHQVLMAPRLRLDAELGWLPGLAPNQARRVVEDTRLDADILSALPLLAGANIAAHRCIARIDPALDELLLRFYDQRDDNEIRNLLNFERKASGFPEITADLFADAMPHLVQQHVHAFVQLITGYPQSGSKLLTILKRNFDGGRYIVGFLDDVVECFDTWAVAPLQAAEASISECLHILKNDRASLNRCLPTFSAAIATWSSLAAPRQYILGRRHLKDPRSEHLLSVIRVVCLYLNNQLDDPRTPLTLTEAAVPAFAESPEHLEQVRADIRVLKDRVSTSDALKVLGPLNHLVEELKLQHSEICLWLERGDFKAGGRGTAGTLYRLFQSAAISLAGTDAAMVPFRIVLSLAIDLHNDSSASDPALILIRALQAFHDVSKDKDTATGLRENGLVIYRAILQKKLATAAQAKKHRRGARLAQDLENAAGDGGERAEWKKLRLEFERRSKVQLWKYGVITIEIVGLIGYGMVTDRQSPRESPPPSAPLRQNVWPSAELPSGYVVDKEPTFPGITPSPSIDTSVSIPPISSSGVLSAPELRWCLFELARLKRIREIVGEQPFGVVADAWNARHDDCHSRCDKQYYDSDSEIAKRQVDASSAALDGEARSIIELWSQAARPAYQAAPSSPVQRRSTAWPFMPHPVTPPPAPPPQPRLLDTSSQADVRLIQQRLATLSYYRGQFTGSWKDTAGALRHYKVTVGLPGNAVWDMQTQFRLFGATGR